MARVIGKAFKIKKRDVRSYGYKKPNSRTARFARNGGVTAIAAINGRGAYLRHRRNAGTARSMMSGLSPSSRLARARALTRGGTSGAAHRPNAARRSGTSASSKNPSAAQVAAARARIRARLAAAPKKTSAVTKRRKPRKAAKKPTRTNKRKSMRTNARRHRRNKSAKRSTAGRKTRRVRRTRRAHVAKTATPKRRRVRRARKASASPKRRRRSRKASHVANPARRRSRKAAAAPKRRRVRRSRKAAAAPKRRRRSRKASHVANPTRRRRTRRHRKNATTKRRRTRRSHRKNASPKRRRTRRTHRKNAHKRRRTHRRNASSTRRRRTRRSHRKNAHKRRRTHRRNGMMANRRHRRNRRSHRKNAHKRRRTHRRNGMMANRRHRRNGRKYAFRKNGFLATLGEVAKIGALTTAGFVAHKALTKLFCDQVLDRLLGSSGAVTPPAAPAVSGLEALQPYRNVLGGLGVGLLGVWATNKVVKDARTKMFITAGIATSFVHSTAVMILGKLMPQYTGYLAGHDGTAASISAMYGLGAGASLQPHYAPISGVGEYFAQNGIGEYFAQNGFGNGLGSYGANPDLMQAAAGYGIVENTNSDHVNPGDDLDRQLTIAEAAAGVGALPAYEAAAGMGRVQPFEASAGVGEYFAQNGFGDVSTVPPTADTWIPGGGPSPQIWAGTRSISQGQSANELNSAGILETNGNNGVFG